MTVSTSWRRAHRRRHRSLVVSAVGGLVAAALAGCTGGGTQADVVVTPSPGVTRPPTADLARFYDQKVVWTDCKHGFRCTHVVVPIDYTQPGGATFRLSVNKLPASGSRAGSLLVNPGGPGASGLDYVRAATTVISGAVRQRYDIVGFDPRGVGASRGLQCLTDPQLDTFIATDGTPDTPAEQQEILSQGEALGAGCQKADPALLGHVSTREAARDLDVLRAVLGDDKLTYLGKSYGTLLGSTYAGLFPTRVGRMVLDGVLDPASTPLEVAKGQAEGFQLALLSFLTDCRGRKDCPLSGSSAEAETRLESLVAGLDAKPLPGEGGRQVTQALGLLGIASALYDKGNWAFLRQSLMLALRGDGRGLLYLADFYDHRGPNGHFTDDRNEVIYAVNCLDARQTADLATFAADAATVATISPLFGAYIVWANVPCSTWPVPATGRPAPIAARGAAPILVVGTTRDPATPYRWAKSVAGELDSGHLLTYVGDGHTAYRRGSPCVDSAVDAYFLRGTLPGAGARCH